MDPSGNGGSHEDEINSGVPTKIVTFNYTKPGANASAQIEGGSSTKAISMAPRKRHLSPLSGVSFERPVADSLRNLSQYQQMVKQGTKPVKEVEEDWYLDLTNVGQRLKFLRDTFKVIQSVRKRKMMGERADFRTVYDAHVSRTGSPSLLDDEGRNPGLSDEDVPGLTRASPAPHVMTTPMMSRRGRPRKRRGRVRKSLLGRDEMDVSAVTAKPLRTSRRILENNTPLLPGNGSETMPGDSRETTPAPGTRRRGRRRLMDTNTESVAPLLPPEEEIQGPPLMHLPPILPSQRLSLVKGIPPYRYLPGLPPAAVSLPSQTQKPGPSLAQVTPQPFLPSQASFASPPYGQGNTQRIGQRSTQRIGQVTNQGSTQVVGANASSESHMPVASGPSPGYLPSQLLHLGVIPFLFQKYTSVPGSGLAALPPIPAVSTLKPPLLPGASTQPAYPSTYPASVNYASYSPAFSYSTSVNRSLLHKLSEEKGYSPIGLGNSHLSLSQNQDLSQAQPQNQTQTQPQPQPQPQPQILNLNPSTTLALNLVLNLNHNLSLAISPKPAGLMPIKPVTTLGPMTPLGSSTLRGPGLAYPRIAPLAATPVPRFSSWQLPYSDPKSATDVRGIVLPKIHQLEKEIKPWSPEYKPPGPKDEPK